MLRPDTDQRRSADHFGLDYAAAHPQLTAYLAEGIRDRITLRPAQHPRLPAYPVRPASETEIARRHPPLNPSRIRST